MMEKRTITVFEDRYSTIQLTQEQRKELLLLEPIWGSQHFILRADERLMLRKYVGFVATPHVQMQILPKIFQDRNPSANGEDEKQQAIQMLFRLLQYSEFLSIKEIPNPQSLSRFDYDLLEIFIHLFLHRFLQLFQHHIHRQYEQKEENLQFIKGKIMFQKTIQKNKGFKHLHYVQYEDFTEDNLLNRIFKTIMISLRSLTKNPENKKKLNICLVYLEDVQTIKLSKVVFDKVRFNRLNEAYRPVYNLAKLFYHNQLPGMSSGDEHTFTFLVPLNQLFEYTVYKLLLKGLPPKEYKVQYQVPQKYLDTSQNKFLLKPDITISDQNGQNIKFIVDAKYKNPEVDTEMKAAQSDIYQMLAYAVRYKCDQLCLVYPKFKGNKYLENPLASYSINNGDHEIHIRLLQINLIEQDMLLIQSQMVNDIIMLRNVD